MEKKERKYIAEGGFEVKIAIHKNEHLVIDIFKDDLHIATVDFDRLTSYNIVNDIQNDVEANTDIARDEGYNVGYDKGFEIGYSEGWNERRHRF